MDHTYCYPNEHSWASLLWKVTYINRNSKVSYLPLSLLPLTVLFQISFFYPLTKIQKQCVKSIKSYVSLNGSNAFGNSQFGRRKNVISMTGA